MDPIMTIILGPIIFFGYLLNLGANNAPIAEVLPRLLLSGFGTVGYAVVLSAIGGLLLSLTNSTNLA